ncbi:MAG: sigma-70 family RNA polymerase sigma factor [Oscillospiraceae bacterium]|nr:sigma-70 family RNA polymerase sigma factor [Oscillospiraceae bacterium]MCD8016729.1 sigma-70 family RNA polymerase sigma factor [Oscillospiraceae bacterium]MCD8067096.1 sigma-70 family RNA polymerase sigma factor [Oscillospiraceae bacterium]MCD8100833.1 sigma-70 family RNA polymerase sigma factor [Oscillospiraceae bacterium]MCD8191225.1 sigma-70 family RNA polymerase sigma factor [Oscillospiraceae bacterium]
MQLTTLTDNELQALAASGNTDAENELAIRYSRLVRACARPYFLAGGDSEDLTQEGMLGLLTAIRRFDPEANDSFRSFAMVCIRSRILSAVRNAARLKHMPLNNGVSLDDILSSELDNASASQLQTRTPEELILARESANDFLAAYSRYLSPMEKKTLSLYLDGMSYAEISQRLGCSLKSVDNAVQRIRRKLAQKLQNGDNS